VVRHGRRGRASERGDDALAVELEDPFLLAAHEIDVELTDADGSELAQLCDVLLDLAGHAETVDGFVVDECGIRRPRFGVVLVVVPGSVPDVRGEIGGQALLAVALHQIDDVVRHERREPADTVANLVAWSDMGRRRDHDRQCALITPGLARTVS